MFIKDFYSKPAEKFSETNKTVVKHIDNTWSLILSDMVDCGIKNKKCCRYVLVVTASFSKNGLGVSLKKAAAQTIINEFSKIIHRPNRKPSLIEADVGKEIVNTLFTEFQNNNDNRRLSGYKNKGTVFPEKFYRTKHDLLKEPVFKKRSANWIDGISKILKKNKHPLFNKMTPIQKSIKAKETEVYKNTIDKRKKREKI